MLDDSLKNETQKDTPDFSGASRGVEANRNNIRSTDKMSEAIKKNEKVIICTVVLLIFVSLLFGVYSLGHSKGKKIGIEEGKKQAQATTNPLGLLGGMREENRNYWSIVGTVESVDGKKITVKNNKGKVETAEVNDDAKITQKGVKDDVELSAVKVGQEVILTGEKNDDVRTAKTVRIK